jgi:hypothetical protein
MEAGRIEHVFASFFFVREVDEIDNFDAHGCPPYLS